MFLQRWSEVRLRSHSSGRMGSSLPLRVCRLEEVSSPCLRLCFLSGGALSATFVLSPPRSSARPQWLETSTGSCSDYVLVRPGPNFDWFMVGLAAAQPTP